MKKFVAIFIIAILAISTLIFPAMAAVNANSVTWDGYAEWKNSYQVRAYAEVFSYTGLEPMAITDGKTNIGNVFYARAIGIEAKRSSYVDCELSIPLLRYCNSYAVQG